MFQTSLRSTSKPLKATSENSWPGSIRLIVNGKNEFFCAFSTVSKNQKNNRSNFVLWKATYIVGTRRQRYWEFSVCLFFLAVTGLTLFLFTFSSETSHCIKCRLSNVRMTNCWWIPSTWKVNSTSQSRRSMEQRSSSGNWSTKFQSVTLASLIRYNSLQGTYKTTCTWLCSILFYETKPK